MKYATLAALAAAALWAGFLCPPAAAERLSDAEKQYINGCRDNVRPPEGKLSPAKSAECLARFNAGGGAMMRQLNEEAPVMAAEVVARNSALTDLREIVAKYGEIDLVKALQRVLEYGRCVPCAMGLGPEPEKVSPWVHTYLPAREPVFRASVREWDSLGELRTAGLSAAPYSRSRESWGKLTLGGRYGELHRWAKDSADKLIAAAALAGGEKPASYYRGLAGLLKEDLLASGDTATAARLDAMTAELARREAEAAKKPAGESSAEKLSGSMADAAGGLAAAGKEGDAGGFLNKAFDNSQASGSAAVPAPGASAGITKEQAAELAGKMAVMKDGRLTGALADELRGTRAGGEIIAFYENGKYSAGGGNNFNFGFEKGTGELEGTLGWWKGTRRELRMNSDVVDKFTAGRGVTAEQLLASPALQSELAAYLAPTFVHEATHQRQTAWSAARGVDFLKDSYNKYAPYQMEMETESYSMAASFVAEKAGKGGAAYLARLGWWDRDDAARYLADGVDGLRTEKHTYDYYAEKTDSLAGAGAVYLDAAADTARRAAELSEKEKAGNLTVEEKEELKTARRELATRYKWYAEALAKSKADEAKLLEWRDAIDPDGGLLGTFRSYSLMNGGKK